MSVELKIHDYDSNYVVVHGSRKKYSQLLRPVKARWNSLLIGIEPGWKVKKENLPLLQKIVDNVNNEIGDDNEINVKLNQERDAKPAQNSTQDSTLKPRIEHESNSETDVDSRDNSSVKSRDNSSVESNSETDVDSRDNSSVESDSESDKELKQNIKHDRIKQHKYHRAISASTSSSDNDSTSPVSSPIVQQKSQLPSPKRTSPKRQKSKKISQRRQSPKRQKSKKIRQSSKRQKSKKISQRRQSSKRKQSPKRRIRQSPKRRISQRRTSQRRTSQRRQSPKRIELSREQKYKIFTENPKKFNSVYRQKSPIVSSSSDETSSDYSFPSPNSPHNKRDDRRSDRHERDRHERDYDKLFNEYNLLREKISEYEREKRERREKRRS